MLNRSHWAVAGATAALLGLSVGTFAPLIMLQSAPAIASPEQATASPEQAPRFSDTDGTWAQPFIQNLASQNLVKGYPDGTFKPDLPVRRDEFAAMLSQAFNQVQEDPIADGSVYNDIPNDYWAKDAIEEAHESGFMSGYPGGFFAPDRPISRTEALVSLAQNLNLEATPTASTSDTSDTASRSTSSDPAATQSTAPPAAVGTTAAAPAASQTNAAANPNQPARAPQRQARRNSFLMPMALTTLMQPFVAPARAQRAAAAANRSDQPNPATTAAEPNQAAQGNADQNTTAAQANTTDQARSAENQTGNVRTAANNTQFEALPSEMVSNYYADANKIPLYAVDAIATATRAGLVVNYPDPKLLNPDRPATRAEVAALIHQALVHQGRLTPITNAPASPYIIQPGQAGQ